MEVFHSIKKLKKFTTYPKLVIDIKKTQHYFKILLRYRISPFLLVFLGNITRFFVKLLYFKEKKFLQKKHFYQKAIDNFKKTCYKCLTLLNFLTNPKDYSNLPFKNKAAKTKLGLQKRSGLSGSASKKQNQLRKFRVNVTFQWMSSLPISLQELNVFHSISKIKKK